MNFEQIVDEATELLRRRQRVTYGALKRQFGLDDAALHDLKQELVLGQRVARDEDGAVLVWTGAASAGASAAAAAAPAAAPQPEAERRQLTILFCDLADSTALSNALDVEELRGVLRAFQDCAGAVLERHQGFVNSFLGDGIVAFFGYPQAREDDARRAVRAGLDLVASVAAMPPQAGTRLRVRVGIATGVVVVGDVIGKGPSREEAVVGSTSNLAARLQSVAKPGEVVIAAGTHRLLGQRFDCAELGPQTLKGFAEPVPAWRVAAERTAEAALQADAGAHQSGPMVGREIEFPAVMARWREACEGRGQIVTLRGEPGLGKSRLCQAVREAVAAEEHLLVRNFGFSQFQNTALYPVLQHLRHAAGLADGETDAVRLAKLEALLQRSLDAEQLEADLPYFAAALGIPTGTRCAAIADSPERQREHTLRALCTLVLRSARQAPVLMLFEDLHWVDPTSMALLDQLAKAISEARVMVLATSRPGLELPWAELPNAVTIDLTPLKRHHRAAIVARQAGGKALPAEVIELILNKSDGNPLYVEELTKTLIESGLLRDEGERYVLTGALPAQAVPSTLHDSLLARLDRLGPAKEVAQAGAAIGRESPYRTLAAVVTMPADGLHDCLGQLTEVELLQARGVPPQAVYTFRHALIQDAAYATMLRTKRQALHARIAQVLETDAALVQRAPELLAHHHAEAGQIEKAAPYLLQAGLRASAAAAQTEACKYFDKGLQLVATLPDEATRNRLELPLRLHLGMSLAATRGFAAPEVEATQARARELCQHGGNDLERFWVERSLAALYLVRCNLAVTRELGETCVQLAQRLGRPECLVEGLLIDAYAQGFSGDLARASEELARVVDLYRHTEAGRFDYPTPQDPLMAALCLQSVLSYIQGDEAAALRQAADLEQVVQERQRPFDQAWTHTWLALLETLRRHPEAAIGHAGKAMELSQRHGYPTWLAAGAMHMGIAKAQLGAGQEGIAFIGGTLPAWRAAGAELNNGYFIGGLARAYASAGQLDDALRTIDEAIEHARQHGEAWMDAALYRQRGELRLQRDGQDAQALADFEHAIEIARRQGARTFQLRAAVALARVLAASDGARARSALHDALVRFHGTPDTADHREAAALLAQIGA